jgi:hypothetical protein
MDASDTASRTVGFVDHSFLSKDKTWEQLQAAASRAQS